MLDSDAEASMADQVCLVTGAVEGIGWAAAQLLARRGAHVVLAGRVDDERLSGRVADLVGRGHRAEGLACDVTQPQQVADCYQTLFRSHRKLDVLVANAGVLGDARLGMISEELLTDTLEVNLSGAIRHIQAAGRLMLRSKSGSIVAVSSIIGTNGNPGQVAYSASKAGLIGAVKSAAKELAPSNIRVNAVAPGFIATRMISHLAPDVREERLGQVGMERPGTADEVAQVIGFLAGPGSTYVTGQVIGVDGAMVI